MAEQYRVLALSEDDTILSLLQDVLSEDYDLLTMHDSLDALDCLQRVEFTLLIIELSSLSSTGVVLVRLLRGYSKFNALPILAFSTEARLDPDLQDLVDGLLPAPFELGELRARVAETIQTAKLGYRRRTLDGGSLEADVLLRQSQALRQRLRHLRWQSRHQWSRTQGLFTRNRDLLNQLCSQSRASRHFIATIRREPGAASVFPGRNS